MIQLFMFLCIAMQWRRGEIYIFFRWLVLSVTSPEIANLYFIASSSSSKSDMSTMRCVLQMLLPFFRSVK